MIECMIEGSGRGGISGEIGDGCAVFFVFVEFISQGAYGDSQNIRCFGFIIIGERQCFEDLLSFQIGERDGFSRGVSRRIVWFSGRIGHVCRMIRVPSILNG